MEVSERPPRTAERPESLGRLDARDARQLLAQVVGVALAVVGRVKDAVDVVEDVLLRDRLAGVGGLEVGEAGIGDAVAAVGGAAVFPRLPEEGNGPGVVDVNAAVSRLVDGERERTAPSSSETWESICHQAEKAGREPMPDMQILVPRFPGPESIVASASTISLNVLSK